MKAAFSVSFEMNGKLLTGVLESEFSSKFFQQREDQGVLPVVRKMTRLLGANYYREIVESQLLQLVHISINYRYMYFENMLLFADKIFYLHCKLFSIYIFINFKLVVMRI